ncbi:MAG TPA: FHA domain-containing protein [Solirubrobacter sp.]|nr:FHA domain-containing protein [Solirubrobacter sp.]
MPFESPEEIHARVFAERRGGPFLLYRGDDGQQIVVELERDRIAIGRRATNDVALPWDAQVSRVHAELACIGGDWIVCDEGISHNGTFVNGQRVPGRRRLRGGDVITVGDTVITFCAPHDEPSTVTARAAAPAVTVTPAQRRVLEALCRPLAGPGYAAPATNQQIAAELYLSVDTVKGTLSALFERFGLEDLPPNQKRATLAARARDIL